MCNIYVYIYVTSASLLALVNLQGKPLHKHSKQFCWRNREPEFFTLNAHTERESSQHQDLKLNLI